MKKIFAIILTLAFAAALFAGIPHPVFVEYDEEGNPASFEAYLASDMSFFLEDTSVGCGILEGYSLLMVECGNFPIWAFDDILYIVMTDYDYGQTQWCQVTLSYDNVQVLPDDGEVWTDGTPGGEVVILEGAFAPGWNLWSYNVQLTDHAVATVFEPLIGPGDPPYNLQKVKSITQSYDPALLPQFNTLSELVDGYGYWVNVTVQDTLALSGDAISLSTEIALDAGWNLAAFLPQTLDDVEHAFASLIVAPAPYNLLKVKSITQSYDPGLLPQFNTLSDLYPGNGYWVKLTTAVTDFTYPAPVVGRGLEAEATIEYLWTPVIYTNSTCAYASLEAEGQIAAFVNDECRGVSQINQGCVSLVINGETAETATFKLYQNGQVTDLNTQITTAPGEDVFFEFPADDVPLSTQMLNAYPNPFNPETTIAYQLAEDGDVNISIYNIKGQKVTELTNEHQTAGEHNIVWKADGQPSGIYFVRMHSAGIDQTQKVVLMK